MKAPTISMAVVVAASAVLVGPAWPQQVKQGSETGTGLVGGEVPPYLKQVQADPYKPPATPACETAPAEIRQLTSLIGPDFHSATVTKEESLTERGVGVARGLIPYGGVVRFATGADKKDKAVREAVEAGFARRGFLRGLLFNMTCTKPAPPPAPAKPKPRK